MVEQEPEARMAFEIPVEIVIDIEFPTAPGAKPTIRTNARRDALEDLLTEWLRWRVMTTDKDERAPLQRGVYRIKIGLSLPHSEFCTESNTGNSDLTMSVVVETLQMLDEVPVLPLDPSARPAP